MDNSMRLHRAAMEQGDEADSLRRRGRFDAARKRYQRAADLEREAAASTTEEPSRSILLSSAAAFAAETEGNT